MSHAQDLENATKAAQTAQLLLQDLQDLNRSGNALLSLAALSEIHFVAQLKDRLDALVAALQVSGQEQSPQKAAEDCNGAQSTREDLKKAVPFADEESIGEWDDVPAAIAGMNAVIAVIHAEHPCSTQAQLDNAAWLGNAAHEEFCRTDGSVEKTIDYVRSRMEG